MPQKSIEQYERELMDLYRMALAKDPNYAALARRHSEATAQERIPQEEKIDVAIPAPGVEEVVPLPEGVVPIAQAPAAQEEVTIREETTIHEDTTVHEEVVAPEKSAALPKVDAAEAATVFSAPWEPALQPKQDQTVVLAVALPVPDVISQPEAEAQTQVLLDTTEDEKQTELQVDTDTAAEAPSEQPLEQQALTKQPTPAQNQQVPSVPEMPIPAEMRRVAASPNLGAGNLIVNVTTQNRTKPVAEAVVIVSHPEESGNKVIAEVVTDENGKTGLIRLPAPIREIPVYPQPIIGGDLSAQYLVTVAASGYKTARDAAVLIFDGVTSVKSVDLESETEADMGEAETADEDGADVQGQ